MNSITAATQGASLPRVGGVRLLLIGIAAVGVGLPLLLTPAAAGAADSDTVELAGIVAQWPHAYTVTATKSEPTYVEHITSTRDGDDFALEIVMTAQGTGAGGTSHAQVHVSADGAIVWGQGCTASDCDDARTLRGFLSTALIVSAQQQGRLPATGTLRTLGSHDVVCVTDAALHPDAPATLDLEPCFSVTTGAVLGHYSPQVAAFVGATMSATTIDESSQPAARLLAGVPSSP